MPLLPADPIAPARGHSRSRRWEKFSHGLYTPRRVRTLAEELGAWQLVLPRTAAFSHLTAADLLGWWLPAPLPHPVFVAMASTSAGPRRAGLRVCRHPRPVAVHLRDGLRVTTPAETLIAAARDLGVLDLVLMADSALRLKHCTLTELKIAAGRRRRGAPLLRTVIPLLDPRSESAWESIMRVLHRAADIPVDVQYKIFDEAGQFVARADLRVCGTRRLHEYDGAGHREKDVHQQDLARDRALLAAGWQRYGYTSGQLIHDSGDLIADADRLLGRTWDPARRTAWDHLIATSLYGRQGRARALAHWYPRKVARDCAENGEQEQLAATFGEW